MTGEQLMYATMLALTKQNMAFKLAPLSTAQMQGQVINRNIAVGETVVCWMNNSGELTRVGAVPNHYGDFFVDDNNLMYYKKGSRDTEEDNRLVVCDALSGDVISDSEVCIDFRLSGDNQIGVYCIEESYDEPKYSRWIVIHKDGTRSQVIERDVPRYTQPTTPRSNIPFMFGYRNGILAVCSASSSTRGWKISTYTKDGVLLKNLYTGNQYVTGTGILCPISDRLVCVAQILGAAYFDYSYAMVSYYSEYGITNNDPHAGYIWPGNSSEYTEWIGTDGPNCYLAVRICINIAGPDETPTYVWTDEWDIVRVSIDHFDTQTIAHIDGTPSYRGMATTFGHIIQSVDGTRTMVDISTMDSVYTSYLSDLPDTMIQENVGWIWIPGKGVYQKTPLDWLMSASGEYPRESPWGKCGYAIGDYKVGQNGLAIVLFE